MYTRYVFSAFIFLLGATLPARAQRVEARLSADTVAVGDRFTLTLVAVHGFDTSPSFPHAGATDSAFGDLEVLDLLAFGTLPLEEGAARLDSVVYAVTTFALDTARVPPLAVSFNGGVVIATSDSLLLPIQSLVPEEAAAIRGLAGLVDFSGPVWPYLLLAFAVVTGAGLLYYYMRHRSPPLEITPSVEETGPSPYEHARTRLRALETANTDAPDYVVAYFVELSDALRTYFEDGLGVPALECTTRELAMEFKRPSVRHKMPGGVPERVHGVLSLADLVKFADVMPPQAQSRSALVEAQDVVERIEAKLRQLALDRSRIEPAPAPHIAPAD